MSRTTEHVIDHMNFESSWLQFIETLINESNYGEATAIESPDFSDFDEYKHSLTLPDLTFRKFGEKDKKIAIELKIYRWRRDLRSMVNQAIAHLEKLVLSNEYSKGILIVTLDLDEVQSFKKRMEIHGSIEIWDFGKLREIADGHEQLQNDLEDLIAETVLDDDYSVSTLESLPPLRSPSSERGLGRIISNKLKGTEGGNRDWREFERLCEEAIKCLFGDEIKSWRSQNRTEDELNRMDLIGRINTGTESFWSVVERDFRTRYVVFEAKNYKEPIKQGEIYTTEKYLFTKALRSVAIIIARNGCDQGAERAAAGALREQGKLMLILTLVELCEMLERFDQGDPPENALYEKMDDLLMQVAR